MTYWKIFALASPAIMAAIMLVQGELERRSIERAARNEKPENHPQDTPQGTVTRVTVGQFGNLRVREALMMMRED